MSSADLSEVSSTPFLKKLFSILNDAAFESVSTWTDDGLAFTIKNIPAFTESVLPKYFKHNNYSSFIRQLNNYGFHKVKDSNQIFHHPFFAREKPELLKKMTTKKDKGMTLALCQKLANSELGPAIGQLIQLNNQTIVSEEHAKRLKNKVETLSEENKLIAQQCWQTNQRIKNVKNILLMIYQQCKDSSSDIISLRPNISGAIPLPFNPPAKRVKVEGENDSPRRQVEELLYIEEPQTVRVDR
ncbi:unnamed protein product [Blepharisma stoltei]|uniref:HSF-type DNA-binding domain-containing protein n=1 Tax=Blepharisma stoltei TaxID=1481888 RepID=A0AAU9JMP9_9CILI|nr:unnamed protein product [Blepharisma stoltei]